MLFRSAMDDDFNTSVAIAELQQLKSDVNKLMSQGLSTEARKIAREEFRSLGHSLGLFQLDKWQFNPDTGSEANVPFGWMNVDSGGPSQASRRHPAYDDTHLSNPPLTLLVAEADQKIKQKVDERNEARQRKDFKRADEIRAELALLGITIEDKPDGTSRWKR